MKRSLRTREATTTILLFFLLTTLVACANTHSSYSELTTVTPLSSSSPLTTATPLSSSSLLTTVTPEKLAAPTTCVPTFDDGISPSYKPDAPIHSTVGTGHVLTGVVLSSKDCMPIQHAKLEFWPEYEGLGHPDEDRVTIYTDAEGRYRFECNLPDHIHMRISAPGFITIGQNSYHPNGKPQGTFDIVLKPAP